jgi:HEPN domain-containing protein
MTGSHQYRLKLATGFLQEASQDVALQRWRSAMDNAQLAVENAGKGVLALIGPVGRTHQPAPLLREALQQGVFPVSQHEKVRRLAELAELLGPDVHIQTDYGDEVGGLTPWELFDEADSRLAFAMADEAVNLARSIVQQWPTPPSQQADEGENA